MSLLGPVEIRNLAEKLDIRPTKKLGQNFVIDGGTVRRIVRVAGLRPDDVVIEVGPGLGSLTLALLPEARGVVAVEIDPVLAAQLPLTVAERAPEFADRLTVVLADAMRVLPDDLPQEKPTALVANLPYNVSVPVVLHLLETLPSLRTILVMVQSEVADRLAAGPGSKVYGIPSVKAAWYADVRRAGPVGRTVFWPIPNVDSGLVAMTRREPLRPGPPARTSSPSSTPPSPSGARPCAPPWPPGPVRPPPPSRRSARPESTLRSAASSSPSRISRGSPSTGRRARPRRRPSRTGAAGDPVTIGDRDQQARGEARMNSVTVRVPAKVNLQLAVGPLRDDGYHDLVNVFHAVSIFDEVTATAETGMSVRVEGEGADQVPDDDDNLAIRAALALAGHAGRSYGVNLVIRKAIPVAGGMAGGSADAAAALVACNELWGLGLPTEDLLEIAADLGSDVPFALLGGTAVGTGRGSGSPRWRSAAGSTGCSPWPTAACPPPRSTPSATACVRLSASRSPGPGRRSRCWPRSAGETPRRWVPSWPTTCSPPP